MKRPRTGLMACLSQEAMDGLAARSLQDNVATRFSTDNSIRLSGGWWLVEMEMEMLVRLHEINRDPDVAVRWLLETGKGV